MSYDYTVFLSYHRGRRVDYAGQAELSAAGCWVHEVLYPALQRWLPEFDPYARIAFDGDLPPGARSEPALRGMLQRSRCMLAKCMRRMAFSRSSICVRQRRARSCWPRWTGTAGRLV